MAESENILLERFVRNGDAEAFSEIVQRHAGLVYGACLRILDDSNKAADVVQDTFFQLLRNAGKVTGSVPCWLHRVATRKALNAVRSDARRKKREAVYSANKPIETDVWEDVSVYVDQALDELDEETRDIIVRHYLEGLTMAHIAEDKGFSQATASRRIDAGVTQLRSNLKRRGVIVTVGALMTLIGQNAVQAAPAVVMRELGKMALIGTTAATASTAAGVSGASTAAGVGSGVLATVQAKIIVAAAVAAVGVGSVVTYNQITKPTEPPASKPSYSRPAATAVRTETERTEPVRVLQEEYTAQPPAESSPPLADNTNFDEQAYDSYDQPTEEPEEEIIGGGFGGMMGGGMGASYGGASAPQNDLEEANEPAETPRYRSRRE